MALNWLDMLKAIVKDSCALETYLENLEYQGKKREIISAWNRHLRADAMRIANVKMKKQAFCFYLEALISRPSPPPNYSEDIAIWELVKEDAKKLYQILRCNSFAKM